MENLIVKEINLLGDTLVATKDREGNIWAAVKWICDGLGLTDGQIKSERKKIQEDEVLKQGGRNFVLPTKGGNQEVLCLRHDFVPLWLAKISITPSMRENKPELVDKLIQYQLKAKDVLAAAFLPEENKTATKELSPLLQELISIEHRLNESERKLVTLQENSVKQTEVLRAVKDTFIESANQENFSQWVNDSISEIANSPVFSCHNYRYQEIWGESYKRLTNKAKCNLDTQLKNARKRAAEDGATKTKVKNISKLQIIANDKKLKELYISVLREMKIAYCVEIA